MSCEVAVVVGHSRDKQGAVGSDGVREWRFHSDLAMQTAQELLAAGVAAQVFTRPNSGTYATRLARLVAAINTADPAVVVALHFNTAAATHSGEWSGTSALHWPTSQRGREIAADLSRAVAADLDIQDRGPIPQRRTWAGVPLYILRDTRAPAVLLETHYGDNIEDHAVASASLRSGGLAGALAVALVDCVRGST